MSQGNNINLNKGFKKFLSVSLQKLRILSLDIFYDHILNFTTHMFYILNLILQAKNIYFPGNLRVNLTHHYLLDTSWILFGSGSDLQEL